MLYYFHLYVCLFWNVILDLIVISVGKFKPTFLYVYQYIRQSLLRTLNIKNHTRLNGISLLLTMAIAYVSFDA